MVGLSRFTAMLLLQLLLASLLCGPAVSGQSYQNKESETLNQILGKADQDLDELSYRLSLLSEKLDALLNDREDAEYVSEQLSKKLDDSQGYRSEVPFTSATNYKMGRPLGLRGAVWANKLSSPGTSPVAGKGYRSETTERDLGYKSETTERDGLSPEKAIQPFSALAWTPSLHIYETGSCGTPFRRPKSCPRKGNRIIGGCKAEPHSWPWQVSVGNEYGWHFCGGILLNEKWVLTARHCCPYDTDAKKLRVGLGMDTRTNGIGRVAKAIPYPYADDDELPRQYDITLLKLDDPVTMTNKISPICLPEPQKDYRDGRQCSASGWGMTAPPYDKDGNDVFPQPPLSTKLLQVDVPLISRKTCNGTEWYDGYLNEAMVCAGYKEGRIDACSGDSGGPLVSRRGGSNTGPWELIGVTSFGGGNKKCAEPKSPGVYAYVPYFVNWIKLTMKFN